MVFRRRFRKKFVRRRLRAGYRKAPSHYRQLTVPQSRIPLGSQPHFFQRMVYLGNLNQTSADTYLAFNFTLNGVNTTGTSSLGATSFAMPNVTEFQNLFDSYKINKIKVMFIPQADTVQSLPTSSSAVSTGFITAAIDFDDSAAPTAVTDLDQYQHVSFINVNRMKKFYFQPKMSSTAYGAGVVTNYVQSKPRWIDMTYRDVEHYGLKVCLRLTAASQYPSWKVVVKYYFSCRQVR